MPQLSITDEIKADIKKLYPGIDTNLIKLYGTEDEYKIFIDSIKVPQAYRGQGIGTQIIDRLKQYAQKVKKPIVLSPEAEPKYKKKLKDFYKSLGFVDNRGRKADPSLSSPFAPTMYWKPTFKEWFGQL